MKGTSQLMLSGSYFRFSPYPCSSSFSFLYSLVGFIVAASLPSVSQSIWPHFLPVGPPSPVYSGLFMRASLVEIFCFWQPHKSSSGHTPQTLKSQSKSICFNFKLPLMQARQHLWLCNFAQTLNKLHISIKDGTQQSLCVNVWVGVRACVSVH